MSLLKPCDYFVKGTYRTEQEFSPECSASIGGYITASHSVTHLNAAVHACATHARAVSEL